MRTAPVSDVIANFQPARVSQSTSRINEELFADQSQSHSVSVLGKTNDHTQSPRSTSMTPENTVL